MNKAQKYVGLYNDNENKAQTHVGLYNDNINKAQKQTSLRLTMNLQDYRKFVRFLVLLGNE